MENTGARYIKNTVGSARAVERFILSSSDPLDYWGEEDFEDTVAATLISCFESKLKKNKGVPPSDRLKDKHLRLFRSVGPYVPSSSRIIVASGERNGFFDLENDQLPFSGCLALKSPHERQLQKDEYDGYIFNILIKQVKALGKYWHRRSVGKLYVMFILSMGIEGRVSGERRYFTVGKDGVNSCEARMSSVRGYVPGVVIEQLKTEQHILGETTRSASHCMQYLADRRFCWVITAKEKMAKAHLGCMYEEIKSLLYARDLPITTTGRKRPVLHLVAAHKRRMKNGTDIDVTSFLRGSQVVTIGNTEFTVHPPKVTQRMLPASKRYF